VAGSIAYNGSYSNPTWSGVTVDGSYPSTNGNFSSYVFGLSSVPSMPVVDTSAYTAWATNTLSNSTYSSGTLTNVIVPANSSVTFTKENIYGVVYMMNGASVTFNGCTIDGEVVQDPAATTGSVTFNNSGATVSTINPVTSAPASTLAAMPTAEQNAVGSAVLAPSASVTLDAGSGSGGMLIKGTMVGYNFVIDKNVTIDGSIIGMSTGTGSAALPLVVNNSTSMTINSPITSTPYTPLYGDYFVPNFSQYAEQ